MFQTGRTCLSLAVERQDRVLAVYLAERGALVVSA